MFTIEKHTPRIKQARMTIKSFKCSEDMHAFLNKQGDNAWRISTKGLKSGTYAHIAMAWHNVKSLDSSVLAHC